jgi:hypothetical protein
MRNQPPQHSPKLLHPFAFWLLRNDPALQWDQTTDFFNANAAQSVRLVPHDEVQHGATLRHRLKISTCRSNKNHAWYVKREILFCILPSMNLQARKSLI